MSRGAKATPDVPSNSNLEHIGRMIVQMLDGGIGEDRVKHYISDEDVAVSASSAEIGVPEGCNLIRIQMGTGDAHINLGGGAATTGNFLYKAGQEYWEGPFDEEFDQDNLPEIIRASADSTVFFQYYAQG